MHSVFANKSAPPVQHQRFQKTLAAEVLLRAQKGDESACTELYKTYSQAVHTLAYGICGNKHCAEDILHNTYIKLFEKLPSFEGRAPLGMWVRQIAVNESLMYLRKHKKHKVVVSSDAIDYFDEFVNSNSDDEAGDAFSSKQINFSEALDNCVDMNNLLLKLPEESRTVLWLKEVEGYTHKEIAKIMNKTPSYSKSIVCRAIQFLRARLIMEKEHAR